MQKKLPLDTIENSFITLGSLTSKCQKNVLLNWNRSQTSIAKRTIPLRSFVLEKKTSSIRDEIHSFLKREEVFINNGESPTLHDSCQLGLSHSTRFVRKILFVIKMYEHIQCFRQHSREGEISFCWFLLLFSTRSWKKYVFVCEEAFLKQPSESFYSHLKQRPQHVIFVVVVTLVDSIYALIQARTLLKI